MLRKIEFSLADTQCFPPDPASEHQPIAGSQDNSRVFRMAASRFQARSCSASSPTDKLSPLGDVLHAPPFVALGLTTANAVPLVKQAAIKLEEVGVLAAAGLP